MRGAFPAEHHVRLGQTVFAVVAQDVFRVRVRDDAQRAAGALVPPEQLAHAVVGTRNVALDVVVPVALLSLHLLLAHADDVTKQRDDAGVEVILYVLVKRIVHLRVVYAGVLDEAGVVNCGGAVNDRVVVIDHQAGVSHGVPPWANLILIIPSFPSPRKVF